MLLLHVTGSQDMKATQSAEMTNRFSVKMKLQMLIEGDVTSFRYVN